MSADEQKNIVIIGMSRSLSLALSEEFCNLFLCGGFLHEACFSSIRIIVKAQEKTIFYYAKALGRFAGIQWGAILVRENVRLII